MTQEEKQLLLIDLCTRLPHKVKIKCDGYPYGITVTGVVGDQIFHTPYFIGGEIMINKHTVDTVRPYLRPMLSMTEEEENEWRDLCVDPLFDNACNKHSREEQLFLYAKAQFSPLDWLNSHYFDYRGLIPMGLALEATEGIYKNK